ncbi:Uncharacterised protein [Mycobacterium tuberculosis]|uniref:Uncharacterized protein n=1 Tax=Mycobacterium tuberculosis TaxID=1773 RepID=A0A916PCC5_MYCTX|nr:Uncharacterised protein [Mycobacterium tuberculosis]CPA35149.1 Uncharacterised protein [Mycobacterium tuberculosis]
MCSVHGKSSALRHARTACINIIRTIRSTGHQQKTLKKRTFVS